MGSAQCLEAEYQEPPAHADEFVFQAIPGAYRALQADTLPFGPEAVVEASVGGRPMQFVPLHMLGLQLAQRVCQPRAPQPPFQEDEQGCEDAPAEGLLFGEASSPQDEPPPIAVIGTVDDEWDHSWDRT